MIADSITQLAALIGISTAIVAFLFVVISVWEAVWTGLAMWKAAKRNDRLWFVVFLIVNILGILEIIYLIITRKKASKSPKEMPSLKKKRK